MVYSLNSKKTFYSLAKVPKLLQISLGLLCLLTFSQCHYTRYLEEDEALLWQQKIELSSQKSTDFGASGILKQQPNQSILGWRPSLMLYSWGDGTDSSLFGKLGNPPVILDRFKAQQGIEQLENYYFNRGFFQVQGQEKIESRKRKAQVTYQLDLGPRYRVDTVEYHLDSGYMRGLTRYFLDERLVRKGDFYSAPLLDKERNRLRDIFRNHGYYNFASSYISYQADTISPEEPYRVRLILTVAPKSERRQDTVVQIPHQRYKISSVSIQPDFSYHNPSQIADTVNFRDYQVVYDTLRYKPGYLTEAIHFEPGDYYSQEVVQETYGHLASYNGFSISEITFDPDTSVGGDTSLQARVKLSPREKYTFTSNVEATNLSNNLGINGSVGLINRNLFSSGEALRLDLSSGLEYQPTLGSQANLSRTFEVGAELSLDFPRFLLPLNTVGLVPKRMLPRSSLSIFTNRTSRVEFDRETFGGRLDYFWRQDASKKHRISILNTSFSRLVSIDRNFISQLSPIQQLAFNSEFISSSRWDFTFNGQRQTDASYYHFVKTQLELGGNIQALLRKASSAAPAPENENETLWGAPIYQFSRLEADYRFFWEIDQEHQWIQRLQGGYVFPYGTSVIESGSSQLRLPPFSRFFFLGGSNDLRAWQAYRAGGGDRAITSYNRSDSSGFSTGTMKFLFSSEYRFPIYSYLKGALFVDAGNIWFTGGLENALPSTRFQIEDLLEDLYIGSGAGLRLDLDYFVIRLDIGLKVRDPGFRSRGKEWVLATKPILPNLVYNIALGYPF